MMSDWSSIHGMSMRGPTTDVDSVLGGSFRGGSTDVDSVQGLSVRGTDIDSLQGEGRDHESNQILSAVADAIEQLRGTMQEPEDKEKIAVMLSQLAESSVDARAAIGYHAQAIPLLVGLLRSGTVVGKTHAAATLGALCDEDELRVKVLLGGCIPPMLGLLKSGPKESKLVAAEAIFAVSKGGGGTRHDVGSKIFATEGVVPALLEQLQPHIAIYPDVVGLLTGALRNLCYNVENFWSMTEEAGGVEIFSALLSSGRPTAQENSAALITSFLTSPFLMHSQHPNQPGGGAAATVADPGAQAAANAARVGQAGAVKPLLMLLEPGKDVPIRTEAAGALRALSAGSQSVRQVVVDAGGVGTLIRATVAPSSEMMQTGYAQMLQENAMGALANIAGGKAEVVNSLANGMEECQGDQELADMIGALAYGLMVLEGKPEALATVNAAAIERALVQRLAPGIAVLVQERSIEALASLYGNPLVAKTLRYSEAKKMLVGLITLAAPENQSELIRSHISLCTGDTDLWTALRGREGVLQLVSLLGLSTEDQQEYSSTLLYILTREKDDSKWAITAAGGIPPLVQLLGTGTAKAREDAAAVLGNLCGFSEDIRACVETAEATPALLSLLGNGSSRGQAVSARALTRLVSGSNASATTIGQLTAILVAEMPESKVHVLRVLGHLLAEAPDVAEEGSASNEALHTLVGLLDSEREESQESSAAVLANLFAAREDLRESRAVIDAIPPLVRLVDYGSEQIAMQAARALAAIFCSIDTNYEAAQVAKDGIFPLVKLAKSSATAVAEVATTALANLLANEELAQFAPAEEVMLPLSRLLREGTAQGKEHAAGALAHLLHSRPVDAELAECIRQCSTVLALVALLAVSSGEEATLAALEALAALARARTGQGYSRPPLQILSEVPYSISPLVTCLASGTPMMQEKAIEVLSRLCKDQPVVLGDLLAGTAGCIGALTERIIQASSLEVKVGGTALLICAAKEHRHSTMECMTEAGTFLKLVKCLVEMLASRTPDDLDANGGESSAAMLVNSVALWLLAVVASHDNHSKQVIAEAGAVEVLTEKLAVFSPNARTMDSNVDDNGGSWVSALLLAILFCDREVTRTQAANRAIPPLANLLKSEEPSDRYFAAEALASLVSTGSRGTLLAVANSGATSGLLTMLGSAESEIAHLTALSEDFALALHPEQVALERLFRCDDIQKGPIARKAVPPLVNLLKPMPERPGAPPLALGLLTQIAKGSEANKLVMAEAGALEALTKYLSIGPQESIEEAAAELLRIMFSSEDLRTHSSAVGAVEQLVAVLRLGTRGARYSAARALEGLFIVDVIRSTETAHQAVSPLVEMMAAGSEKEQRAAVTALIKLALNNVPKIMAIAEQDGSSIEALCRVLLSPDASMHLKEDSAELLRILFGLGRIRASPAATAAITPLIGMLSVESVTLQFRAAGALDNILEDEGQAEIVAAQGAVVPLVSLLEGDLPGLHATVSSALLKLAKDRRLCKLDMNAAGVIERILDILPRATNGLAALFVELLRVLTNNPSIARGAPAGKAVVPLFAVLQRPELNPGAQNSTLQALVNILANPERLAMLSLEPEDALGPLVPLLSSPFPVVQQLAANLASHLLSQETFQKDPVTQQVCVPLVRLLSSEAESLQKESLQALLCVSNSWPNAIADANGLEELSRLVATAPQPMWQSASTVLTNVLRARDQYNVRVPLSVLVRLLLSNNEYIQIGAINALAALEREDSTRAKQMAEAGVVEALLELLRCHQVEEPTARLLEAIFNSQKVREMPCAMRSIAPLSTYLLNSRDTGAKLLAVLALGDLFQDPTLSRCTDAATACKALASILEEQTSEDLQMVAICGLQNLVGTSKVNKKALAEAGGVAVIMDMLQTSTPEITGQVAGLIKLLFNSHAIQEHVSPDLIQSLAMVLERELWKSGRASEEVVRAIESLLQNFARMRSSEQTTAAIPMLVGAMKVGNEAAQEAALNAMFILRQGWSQSKEVAKQQSMACAEAIPVLQLIIRNGPDRLYEKAEAMLAVLPGSLSVTIKRGNNLKLAMGQTNAFCKVTLGESASRTTKVIQQSTSPEWKQGFSWPLDVPPRGQNLHIHCKSKVSLGTGSLGKVTIQIDRVVTLGLISGTYTLSPDTNRDGAQRTLDIEFVWSNR